MCCDSRTTTCILQAHSAPVPQRQHSIPNTRSLNKPLSQLPTSPPPHHPTTSNTPPNNPPPHLLLHIIHSPLLNPLPLLLRPCTLLPLRRNPQRPPHRIIKPILRRPPQHAHRPRECRGAGDRQRVDVRKERHTQSEPCRRGRRDVHWRREPDGARVRAFAAP